jgi:predicted ester cyclase
MAQTDTASIDARTLGRRFFEAQDRLRGGPDEALCAPEYTAVLGGNPPMDRAAHEGFALGFYGAFPDLRHEIEDVFAAGDRVAVRFVLHGTHSGAFFGVPPTNRRIRVAGHVILQVSNDRVAKLLGVFDEAGLMRQLGA